MSATTNDPRRARLASRLLVSLLAGIFLLGLLGFIVAVLEAGEAATREPSTKPSTLTSDAAARVRPALGGTTRQRFMLSAADVGTAPPSVPATPLATDARMPEPSPSVETVGDPVTAPPTEDWAAVPVVPVVSFWSARDGVSRRELVRALQTGHMPGMRTIVVEDTLWDALATGLGIRPHADIRRGDLDAVARSVRRRGLGLVPATRLTPALRPLAIDGRTLVGNDRVTQAADWPLTVTLPLAESEGWDQGATWVLVAGGDSFTDRGVYDTVVRKRRGVDFPFDGGTARVTGHGCCDPVYNDNVVPRYVLTGNRGRVRRLLREADLAIVNHEMPTTPRWGFHSSGFIFSGRPDLTRIFTRAGIDWVSLANNHIKDYGSDGIRDTRRVLRRHGLAFGGAGKDLAQARSISILEVGGVRIAIIPCVDVAPAIWAGPRVAGATPCSDRYIVKDVKRAGRSADVVIVFPHWGVEYTRRPLPSMRKHGARWVKAGADLILGAHSHVAGAIEEVEGSPVLYSLGNLIFDQHWSTDTMESVLLEATFAGPRLLSLRLHPYIVHATAQPNLLDPARGEGRRILRAIRKASADWLDW